MRDIVNRWQRCILRRRLCIFGIFCIAATASDCDGPPRTRATNAAIERGRAAVAQYGCDACHAIGSAANGRIVAAAPLDGIERRSYIAGVLPNSFDNLVRWIRNPQRIKPRTAMPVLDVSDADARNIAAYLYSLR